MDWNGMNKAANDGLRLKLFGLLTKTKTVNTETQIRAKGYGNAKVMSVIIMKRDLPFNDEYEAVTPLFPSMLESQVVEGEDETVYKERGDIMEKAATTASSLEAEQDSVNTLGSGDDSMKLQELIELCIKLSERVLTLENIKIAQDLEITNLKKREDASNQGRNIAEIDQDEWISWFQEDAETQRRYGHDIGISTAGVTTDSILVTTASSIRPLDDSITDDITLAETLIKIKSIASSKEREELTVEEQSMFLAELIETRRKYFAAKRAEENRNKPPTKAQ
ncbi:hypothetical protein Tco_1554735 [Tanacetum coccineum]